VSFVHKQEPSPPLPLRERVASRPGWPGEGVPVSFLRKQGPRLPWVCPLVSSLRKQESSRCHSCASRRRCHSRASGNPERLSPPRERPAVPKAPPGKGATVSFVHKQEPSTPLPLRERVASRPGWPGEGAPCPSCASSSPERNNWIPAFAGMTHKGGGNDTQGGPKRLSPPHARPPGPKAPLPGGLC